MHTKSLYMIEPVYYSFSRRKRSSTTTGDQLFKKQKKNEKKEEKKQGNNSRGNVSPNQQRVYLLLCDYYITERIKRVACSI